MKVLEFTTKDGPYRLKGHGFVYPVNERLPDYMWNPNDLVDLDVLIDGQQRKVLGVEKFAIGYDKNNPYRLSFALLVDTPLEATA